MTPDSPTREAYAKDSDSLEEKGSNDLGIATLDGNAADAKDASGEPLIFIDPKAEGKLRRKIDRMILPAVSLLYLFTFIDRANIGNARIAGLEKDLHLRGYDYNILLSSFYISYVVFEIPSTMLCKIVGPKKWIPFMTFVFGLLSVCTAFITSLGSGIAVRFLLGAAEAGMLPSIAFYLSRFYKKDELAFRLAMYIVMAPGAGAFGGLLASGILKIHNIGTLKTWENIFFVEGIITIGLAFLGYFFMCDGIESAPWLSEEERAMAIARVKSEMVGQTELVDKAKFRSVWNGMTSFTTIMCAIMFLLDNITVQGIAFFLPTVVKTLFPGRSTIHLQLLTVPSNLVGAVGVILFSYASFKFKNRSIFIFIASLFMTCGYAIFLGTNKSGANFAGCFIAGFGAFCMGPLMSSYAAINTNNDSERAGAIGMVVMFGNLGGLIATWSYLPQHAPRYIPGNALNTATSATISVLSLVVLLWQIRENRRRDRIDPKQVLEGKTKEEIQILGNRHPSFRFRY
ncbi:MFS general substrate transporter [Violaceomyces palustris]|uniref:MFS general substrate transporter n=1 Tax=Violaceomyces palustris TaxID=1673888 RepID=A0ACD0P1A2_9BASI|nr:MFS general substrate transporter [Violaceomyces palustris]